MKKICIIIFVIFIVGAVFYLKNTRQAEAPVVPKNPAGQEAGNGNAGANNQSENAANSQVSSGFQSPLARAGERVTKKPFGIFITSQNSPVQPEKFRGYHTGADFEIFPEELNDEIAIKAVCSGELKMKKYAAGYGGVAAESCDLNGQPVTVIYGHLKLASIAANAGDSLNAGDTLGILGAAYSPETNGERKHLHLGFHKGSAVDILGYVQNKVELSDWIDPCLSVCAK